VRSERTGTASPTSPTSRPVRHAHSEKAFWTAFASLRPGPAGFLRPRLARMSRIACRPRPPADLTVPRTKRRQEVSTRCGGSPRSRHGRSPRPRPRPARTPREEHHPCRSRVASTRPSSRAVGSQGGERPQSGPAADLSSPSVLQSHWPRPHHGSDTCGVNAADEPRRPPVDVPRPSCRNDRPRSWVGQCRAGGAF
jgi:hypothetical protein